MIPTIAKVAQSAKGRLIPYLETKGFKHYGQLAFAKVIGDGVHQVISAELSSLEKVDGKTMFFMGQPEAWPGDLRA